MQENISFCNIYRKEAGKDVLFLWQINPMKNHLEYFGQINLIESSKINRLSHASFWVRLKQLFTTLLVGAIVGGIGYVIAALSSWNWLMYTSYILFGLFAIYGIYQAISAKVSQCPYCDKTVGNGAYVTLSANNENLQFECASCHEWLISHEGEVRAYTANDAEEDTKFEAPVLKNMHWPNECMACGRETEHYQDLKKNKLNAAKLIAGRVSVSMAKVPNVPYCGYHRDLVQLKISNEEVRLVFPTLNSMRRYLATNDKNRGKIVKT